LNQSLTRFQGLIRTAHNHIRRVDLLWVPYESYWAALFYFTGSDIFNRITRAIALRKGYSLTNWGLYPFTEKVTRRRRENIVVNDLTLLDDPHAPSKYVTGKKLDIRSEAEIFETLDIAYVPPEKRH
jgi:DNA polymerase/3'-5' exonuclease PolX